jgi:hypothetical protein
LILDEALTRKLDERYRSFTLANMIARIEKRRAVLAKLRRRKKPPK